MNTSLLKRLTGVFFWFLLAGFIYLAGLDFYNAFIGSIEGLSINESRRAIVFLYWVAPLVITGWLGGLWLLASGRRLPESMRLSRFMERIPFGLKAAVVVLILLAPTVLTQYTLFGFYKIGYWLRLALLLLAAWLAGLVMIRRSSSLDWLVRFGALVCVAGAFYAAGGWLGNISNYPFSQSWSEGNRFWDYSMLFGANRYNLPAGGNVFTFITFGRQFLWGIPFLIPGLGIAGVRIWDALLWILPGLILGWVLAGFIQCKGWTGAIWKLLFAVWTFAFLSQGPIYAPLLVSAILAVIAVRQKNLAVGSLLVFIAAYYARLTRFTWMYGPGLWAATLALMAIPNPGFGKEQRKQLVRPLVLGFVGYVGAQYVMPIVDRLSGNAANASPISVVYNPTSTIIRQSLLWERLWPNPTFSTGIVPGAIWAGLPVLFFLFWLWRKGVWPLNRLQGIVVIGQLLAFLGVGLVASVKIGGGSNLHNMDMLWVALAIYTAWAIKDLPGSLALPSLAKNGLMVAFALALIMPTSYAAQAWGRFHAPPDDTVSKALTGIRKEVNHYQKRGEVLFLDQRQLLTFQNVPKIPLVADYEKKYMMDQAMAQNAGYFKNFYYDLAKQRFRLIVSEPVMITIKGEGDTFSDENDYYVRWVSVPLMCFYQQLDNPDLNLILAKVGVELLVPRKTVRSDSPIPCPVVTP
jgi:hypothetical protein